MKKYRRLTPEILKEYFDKGTLRKPTQKEFDEVKDNEVFRFPELKDLPGFPSAIEFFPLIDTKTGRYIGYNGGYKNKVMWFCKCGDEIMIANKKELGLE